MNFQDETQQSILRRIAQGELPLSSQKEFDDLLTLFPDKADLRRAYADFLSHKGEDEIAYRHYHTAADLYIKEGKTIQGIVTKILAWRIRKPTHQEGRAFHVALQAHSREEAPLQQFFKNMPYAEFIAVMLRMSRLQLQAGETIVRAGEKSEDLYFIVSGDIEETFYAAAAETGPAQAGVTQQLSDNDLFGEVFPLDRTSDARSTLRTLTRADLVKISKSDLAQISRKYPLVEELLNRLAKNPSGHSCGRSWVSVRRSGRYTAPVKIQLDIVRPGDPPPPLTIESMSKDISAGGACIDLGLSSGSLPMQDLIGSAAALSIELPMVNKTLSLNGKIVWAKQLDEAAGISTLVGVKFDAVDQETRDLMNVYCFGIDNEQSLMWSLWESYMS